MHPLQPTFAPQRGVDSLVSQRPALAWVLGVWMRSASPRRSMIALWRRFSRPHSMTALTQLRRGRLAPLFRSLIAAPPWSKWTVVLASIGVTGWGDWASGPDISFSVFYLIPIAYATWFVGTQAGILAAAVSATVWFVVDVSQNVGYAAPLVPLWNAGVRLAFFNLGVGTVALVKRREIELARSVLRRTRLLRGETERRRRLERDLLDVTSREHTRMAQDLHDGLGQYVAAMAFHARMLAEDLRKDASPLATQADNLVAVIRRMNQITRHLDRALRVPHSGPGGFAEVLAAHATEFSELTGLRCELHLAPKPVIVLDDFRTLMLFRIVQEACSNAVKHGQPSLIRIVAHLERERLFLQVSDNGIPQGNEASSEGVGRDSMHLRAKLIGATIEMGPSATGGYSVLCTMPMNSADQIDTTESKP